MNNSPIAKWFVVNVSMRIKYDGGLRAVELPVSIWGVICVHWK